jgi:hypothetical protein
MPKIIIHMKCKHIYILEYDKTLLRTNTTLLWQSNTVFSVLRTKRCPHRRVSDTWTDQSHTVTSAACRNGSYWNMMPWSIQGKTPLSHSEGTVPDQYTGDHWPWCLHILIRHSNITVNWFYPNKTIINIWTVKLKGPCSNRGADVSAKEITLAPHSPEFCTNSNITNYSLVHRAVFKFLYEQWYSLTSHHQLAWHSVTDYTLSLENITLLKEKRAVKNVTTSSWKRRKYRFYWRTEVGHY